MKDKVYEMMEMCMKLLLYTTLIMLPRERRSASAQIIKLNDIHEKRKKRFPIVRGERWSQQCRRRHTLHSR